MKLKRFFLLILALVFAACSISYLFLSNIGGFAYSFSRTVSYNFKVLLAAISGLISIPVFEITVLLSPIFIFLIIKSFAKQKGNAREKFISALLILSFIFSTYFITLGIPSKNTEGILELEEYRNPSQEQVISVAKILAHEISCISFEKSDPFADFSKEITQSYIEIYSDAGIDVSKLSNPKTSIIGRVLSNLGIHSYFAFPTGEVIVNPYLPTYAIPFSLAHEYAHFVGEPSEAKANYVAFLACINSENDYIAYSGYISAIEYFLTDIAEFSPEMYINIYNLVPDNAKNDIEAFREYNKKYSDSFIYRLFDKLNSLYLDRIDSNGRKSYSLVTKYIVNKYLD